MLVSLLSMTVGIPLLLYILLCLPAVHDKIRTVAAEELSELLGARVSIGKLNVVPFNRLELEDVSIALGADTILLANGLNAGISVRNLVTGRIVVTDVELMSPDIRVWRDSVGAPLNVQPIFDRLKGKDDKKPKKFNLAVHTVVIRSGRMSYDVLSEPRKTEGLDPSHLKLYELRADLTAPKISNEKITVSLKRLNFTERSGLTLKKLSANVSYTDSILSLAKLRLRLPESTLAFADMAINLHRGAEKISDIELLRESHIKLSDLSPLFPPLATTDAQINLAARAELFADSLSLKRLSLELPNRRLNLQLGGGASAQNARITRLNLGLNGEYAASLLSTIKPLAPRQQEILSSLGNVSLSGSATWRTPLDIQLHSDVSTEIGDLKIKASLAAGKLIGSLSARNLRLDHLVPDKQLGAADFDLSFNLGKRAGAASLTVDRLQWKGHDYADISAEATFSGKRYGASIISADPLATLSVNAEANLTPGNYSAALNADITSANPCAMGLIGKYEGYTLSGEVKARFTAEELHRPVGELTVSDLRFVDANGNGLHEAPARLTADLQTDPAFINFKSDLIDINASGSINILSIAPALNNMLAQALPAYFTPKPCGRPDEPNDFRLTAKIHDDAPLTEFLKLPVKLLYAVTVNAEVNQPAETASLNIDAPYLQNGNSLISRTRLTAELGRKSSLNVSTRTNSKFGDMNIGLAANAADGLAHVTFGLNDPDTDPYSARLDMAVRPTPTGAVVQVEESKLSFGGDEMNWKIPPALVEVADGRTTIHNLRMERPGQELRIDGTASKLADDRLTVKLKKINLDNLFTALRLNDVVQFGGIADGTIVGSGLLGREPILETEELMVKDLKYSHCLMGDARLRSRWNNESRGVEIHAAINGKQANSSMGVDGIIYPMTQELDFNFRAKHAPVGFLHTFMSAWASKVGGHASGKCHLWGNFKQVDMEGDLYAENFALTIGFTNVTYYATDSVHIRPGVIALDGLQIRDAEGHTANVNGRLTHNGFQEPRFRFDITDIDRLLAYDVGPSPESFWWGKIYADGWLTVNGKPGRVDINAITTTTPGSEFFFELSDSENAVEYNFLSFRDVTPVAHADSIPLLPGSPELDKQMQNRVRRKSARNMLTNYQFDLTVNVTPQAKIILIMDPVAGDRIEAYGSGGIGILYGSDTEEMRLFGGYTINKGHYNFTLQDIIRKDFDIREGSTISFKGDPNDAKLDIVAAYEVQNANLTDLDESFALDKELQRTKVPVRALLKVTGSLQDPDIDYGLELPSLTSDVVRKVESIINTKEMLNRQIIYLLAIDRFYTPEYMSATKGNELMSVASGTLSSQLSNILGQLSDKVSVAPSVRSNADNLSDLEVNVALSSTLLNNRLRLNGNFGYRDNTLNTSNTQFVGDFDVEYLLTRTGNWRLKAYNHFNDRSLYLKTSLTTQGLGLVFKHDFDRLFKRKRTQAEPAD